MYRLTRITQPRSVGALPVLARRALWNGLDSEIDRLFEAALGDFPTAGTAPRFPVDLYEDKDAAYVRAELPGVKRDAINVEMVDGYLNLSASRQDGDRTFTLNRSISIPSEVQADKVSATYENGVLTVTLPKQEQAKPRKISVSIN